ncbi:MAG: hypothetical protein JW809_16420 [Pirellulales bacterium]|nr:hypothetical protein [Pirellulales bacterium]
MNELILKELKIVVERAVRPVRATMTRKRRMREELLAHLVAIFEQEIEKRGDGQVALEQAKRRFGDPRELTGQLQEAVPRWDRRRSVLENMNCREGESAWHLAARHFLVMLTIYSLPMLPLAAMLAVGRLPGFGPLETQSLLARAFLLGIPTVALVNVFLSLGSASLLDRIGPVLCSKRWGRILLALLCVLLLPCLVVPLVAGAALLLILMSLQTIRQWRYQTEWA